MTSTTTWESWCEVNKIAVQYGDVLQVFPAEEEGGPPRFFADLSSEDKAKMLKDRLKKYTQKARVSKPYLSTAISSIYLVLEIAHTCHRQMYSLHHESTDQILYFMDFCTEGQLCVVVGAHCFASGPPSNGSLAWPQHDFIMTNLISRFTRQLSSSHS